MDLLSHLASTFSEQPGLYYVAATLLPLASFVLLLLVGGLKNLCRRYCDWGPADSLHRLLGGDTPGRGAAYVATAASAAASTMTKRANTCPSIAKAGL